MLTRRSLLQLAVLSRTSESPEPERLKVKFRISYEPDRFSKEICYFTLQMPGGAGLSLAGDGDVGLIQWLKIQDGKTLSGEFEVVP